MVFVLSGSTADILTVLSEHIYNSLDAGGETRAITLDVSKEFDKVLHAGLLQAKSLWRCRPNHTYRDPILRILESFL